MAANVPHPTPEGHLIRQVRSSSFRKVSIPAAAARIGMSAEQWGYIERGYYPARGGNPPRPFSAPAQTVAKMAHALQITPERLETEGQRPDAAEALREILSDESFKSQNYFANTAVESALTTRDKELIERLATIQRELGSPIDLENPVEQALAAQTGKNPHIIAAELREWREWRESRGHDTKSRRGDDRDAG